MALAVPLRRPLFCQTATWLTPSLCSLPSKATLSETPSSLIPESTLGTPPPGHSPAPVPFRLPCLCNKTPPIRWPPTAIWHAWEHRQGPVGRVCQLRDAATGSGVGKTQAGGWNLPEACFPTHQVVDAGGPLKHPPVASPCGLGFPEHDGWVPGMGTPTDRHRATSVSVQSRAAVTTQDGRPAPHLPRSPPKNGVAEFLHVRAKEHRPPLLVGGVPQISWTGFKNYHVGFVLVPSACGCLTWHIGLSPLLDCQLQEGRDSGLL